MRAQDYFRESKLIEIISFRIKDSILISLIHNCLTDYYLKVASPINKHLVSNSHTIIRVTAYTVATYLRCNFTEIIHQTRIARFSRIFVTKNFVLYGVLVLQFNPYMIFMSSSREFIAVIFQILLG